KPILSRIMASMGGAERKSGVARKSRNKTPPRFRAIPWSPACGALFFWLPTAALESRHVVGKRSGGARVRRTGNQAAVDSGHAEDLVGGVARGREPRLRRQ